MVRRTRWSIDSACASSLASANIDEPLSGAIGCGLTGIAEGHTPIAVEDPIAFHHNPSGSHPDEDRGTTSTVATLDIPKDIVAEGPVFQGHHVDGSDVIASEQPLRRRDFGVLEAAESDGAVGEFSASTFTPYDRQSAKVMSARVTPSQ